MVTVDMCHKLQAEKCLKSGDVHAHLNKLQVMHEDLASMGGSIPDEDFTSIVLKSIPLSYDTYIAAIMATSSLMDKTLSPTNLIDAIQNEADRHTIKNPKSKKEEDVAFSASQPTDKGKKGGEKLKKEKGKCFNCKKVGHFAKDCYAKGGGSKGKGPKQKGQDKDKGKESAEKAEEKDSDDDGVWMVSVGGDESIWDWVDKCGGGTSSEYKMWTKEEIVAGDGDLVKEVHSFKIDYSPDIADTSDDDIFSYIDDCDISSATDGGWSESILDLESVLDSAVDDEVEVW